MSGSDRGVAGRRIALNTIVNGAHIVLAILATIPLTPFLIDELGAGPYGLYVLGTSFAGLGGFLGLGELGFHGAVVRYVARDAAQGNWDRVRSVVTTTLTIFLGLGAVAALAIATFTAVGLTSVFNITPDLHDEARFVFFMLSLQIMGEYAALAFTGYLEGLQRYPSTAALSLGQLATFILVAVVTVASGAGVIGVSIAAASASVLHALAAMVVARLQHGHLRPRIGIDRTALPELTQYSWRLVLIRLTSIGYDQMDKVILGVALSPVALTTYDIANKVHLFARYGLSVTTSAVTPAASSLSAVDDRPRLRSLLIRGTRATVALTLPLCVTAMLLAQPLIDAWIGPGFDDAPGVAQLFLAYLIFTSITSVGVTMLIGMGVMDRFVFLGIASMLVNLVVSIVLVGPLGIYGVVTGTTVGYLIITGPYLSLILSRFAISLRSFVVEALGPPFAVGAGYAGVLAAAIAVHGPDSAVQTLSYAALGMLLYGLAYVTLAAHDDERAVLRSLVGRH